MSLRTWMSEAEALLARSRSCDFRHSASLRARSCGGREVHSDTGVQGRQCLSEVIKIDQE
jgi:hypothetical protein